MRINQEGFGQEIINCADRAMRMPVRSGNWLALGGGLGSVPPRPPARPPVAHAGVECDDSCDVTAVWVSALF